jgi:D-alanyl-D-alanine carboxypeptidase
MANQGFRKMKKALLISLVAVALSARVCALAGDDVFHAPDSIPRSYVSAMNANRAAFLADLEAALRADAARSGGLLTLVDKRNPISADSSPPDLVPLAKGRHYVASREGLSLRAEAEGALERMARAALADGVTLVASSTYRSYEYQKKVYDRNVREMGEAAASRESAKPGQSQHQLGTAVDFGSITDDFAGTKAGRWLAAHAGEYGWSLSFPQGLESVTGYRWESWHYRYVGVEATALAERWFGGVQQYMIEFVDAWKRSGR